MSDAWDFARGNDAGTDAGVDVPDGPVEVGVDVDGAADEEAVPKDAPTDDTRDATPIDETASDVVEDADAARVLQIIEYRVPTAGSYPAGIARSPDGAIWFTEGAADRIGKLTADGVFNEFSTSKTGVFVDRITNGRNGDLWFSELFGQKIGRITSDGNIFELDVSPDQPDGVAVGADGSIWYSSMAKVSKLNPNDGKGVDFGNFGTAGAIVAAPDGYLWFCDLTAGNIVRISSTGEPRAFVAGSSSSRPVGLVIDGDHLWFTEYYGNQVGRMVISESGSQPIGTVQEFSIPTLQSLPVSVAVDTSGNVWFTENGASAIGRVSPTGIVDEFPLPLPDSRPVNIVNAPDGTLWFTEDSANRIGHLIP